MLHRIFSLIGTNALLSWRWKQLLLPKRYLSTKLHTVSSYRTASLILRPRRPENMKCHSVTNCKLLVDKISYFILLYKVHSTKKYAVLPHTKVKWRISWSFSEWKGRRNSSSCRWTLGSLLRAIKFPVFLRNLQLFITTPTQERNFSCLKSWYIYSCI